MWEHMLRVQNRLSDFKEFKYNCRWILIPSDCLMAFRDWDCEGEKDDSMWVSNMLVFRSVPEMFKSERVTAPLSAPLCYKTFRQDKLLLTDGPFHTSPLPFMLFVWRIWKNFCGTSDLWTSFAKRSPRTKGKSCLPCNQSASVWATEKCIQATFWKKWVSVILCGGFLHGK